MSSRRFAPTDIDSEGRLICRRMFGWAGWAGSCAQTEATQAAHTIDMAIPVASFIVL